MTPNRLLSVLASLVRVDSTLAEEGRGGPILHLDPVTEEVDW